MARLDVAFLIKKHPGKLSIVERPPGVAVIRL